MERENKLPGNIAPMWSVDECAAFLGKSSRWLWNVLRVPPNKPGSIPYSKVGRSPRFCPEMVQEWVNADCPPADTFRKWKKKK